MLATKQTQLAIQLLYDNLELAKEIGSTQILPYTYINLGIAHFHLKEYQKSLEYKLEALKLIKDNGRKDIEVMIYAEVGKSLIFTNRLEEAAEKLCYSLHLGRERQNIKDSYKALIFWSQYLIVTNQKEQALKILSFVKASNGMTEEDEVEANKLHKALAKCFTTELNSQINKASHNLELESLIESILQESVVILPPRTIDSTQLTTSL